MPKTPYHPPAEYLWGKRQAVRQARELDVECVGTGSTIHARTVDLSPGGMLVEARDQDLPPVGPGELVPLAYLVAVAFQGGMKAVFTPEVTVRAEVVRVTTSPLDPGFLRLGCRFLRRLTPRQCRRLGIEEPDEAEAALDLGRSTGDGGGDAVVPVEMLVVAARPGKRKPGVKIAPFRERRKREA